MSSHELFQSARRAPRTEVLGALPLLVFCLAGGTLLGSYLAPVAPASARAAEAARAPGPEFDGKIRGALVAAPAHPAPIAHP